MLKVNLPNTWGYLDFITLEEQAQLLNFALKNKKHLGFNGAGRYYKAHIDKSLSITPLYKKIRQKIIDIESLHNFKYEPTFGDFLSFNESGGSIHKHIDPNLDGHIHTRYNLIISMPESGGQPIYNDEIINIKERMLWRCEAGLYNHSSTPVEGNKPRINISFGFQILKLNS